MLKNKMSKKFDTAQLISELKSMCSDIFEQEAEASTVVLTDENIQKHIQAFIKYYPDNQEIEKLIRDKFVNSIKIDIAHYKTKNRTIFADSPRTYEDAVTLLNEHYTELESFISETINKAKLEIPDSEEKSMTIPYTVLECAAYAIQYADNNLSPVDAVKQNLYSEILKEIAYLQS